MSKIKLEDASFKKVFSGFGGIRCDTARDGKAAYEMRNFRIRCDGSLEKREGFGPWRQFSDTVRAFWEGSLHQTQCSFVVTGATVVRLTNSLTQRVVGTLPSSYGKVCFFKYEETLYLLDGKAIYYYLADSESFLEVAPYAPLLGHNWHPINHGSIHEPINLLTNRIRVHYLNSTATTTFFLPFFAASIDRVRVDNLYTDDYTITGIGNTVEIPSAAEASVVEIAFTRDYESELLNALLQCTHAYVDNGEGVESAFLYGDPSGYRLFASSPVNSGMLNYCKVSYPTTKGLYFKESNLLHLGSSDNSIRALCKQYDRVLAFSPQDGWALEKQKDGDRWESHPILHGFGCSKPSGACVFQNDVLLLDNSGLYRLHAPISHPDDFDFERITAPICEKLTGFFLSNAELFYASQKNELWLRFPDDAEGIVWVRNNDTGEWVCFDNIPATHFYETEQGIAFSYQNRLFRFQEALTTDNGAPFSAYYQSDYLCFDRPEAIKRALRICLSCLTAENTVKLTLETEQTSAEFSFTGSSTSFPEVFDRRVFLGRFRFLRFRLSVSGSQASQFYSLSLYSKQ